MSDAESLAGVAAQGNRMATLRALRDRLAAEIDTCPPARDLAALSRQLTLVLAEIGDVPAEGGSFLDELERRRQDRISEAASS